MKDCKERTIADPYMLLENFTKLWHTICLIALNLYDKFKGNSSGWVKQDLHKFSVMLLWIFYVGT